MTKTGAQLLESGERFAVTMWEYSWLTQRQGEQDEYADWDKVLDDSDAPYFEWFPGGEMNTCFNALDRHVQGGRADQAAIIYDSPVTNSKRKISYAELWVTDLCWPEFEVATLHEAIRSFAARHRRFGGLSS